MKKILFIEDDGNFAEIIKTILETSGFAVALAKDGEEGLRAVQAEKPDLILLDLILPKMDGFDFLKYFRAMNDIPWIPVLVFTSQAGSEMAERVKELGAQGYLFKSQIDTHTLVDKLKEFLKD